jgi:hypothetical protein
MLLAKVLHIGHTFPLDEKVQENQTPELPHLAALQIAVVIANTHKGKNNLRGH